jgi:26S proteasome regulatory subunit T4
MAKSEREQLLEELRKKYYEASQLEEQSSVLARQALDKKKERDEAERRLNAFSITGRRIAEITRILDGERYIVESEHHGRQVVQARSRLDASLLTVGRRVALDKATDTILNILPREVDPEVYRMYHEDPGNVDYSDVGGLGDQLNEVREIIELPLVNPQIFQRVGIRAPKGALLYGPPGTGKTLIARAVARRTQARFLKAVSTSLVSMWLGEGAKRVREMFKWARAHAPCIIFIDEIDAIAMRRIGDGQGNDRSTQRILLELLAQLDGFASSDQVKVLMATNRPDVLDPALLRPGRLDRKIEIPLPNENARHEIMKIHAKPLRIQGDVDWDSIIKLSEGFNGADLRNVATEAGMFALRAERDFVISEDFIKAVRAVKDTKGLESTLLYEKL